MNNTFWDSLSGARKFGLVSGIILIFLVTALSAFYLLKPDYQVLFSDLKPQDSAVMVAELDRLKVAYKLDDGGNTILVEKAIVHGTRLKLLGKDLPLHGAVGFELFNNSDFGMTEFAQKINYQRAMQGEIMRTISSLDEIKDVRVHLALPEEGLFKRATSKAKAAITISLKPGKKLRTEQINGIQRLVAAAVPGIIAQDVTIVDQQGVALTRTGNTEHEMTMGNLELKKDTEILLVKKANEVLERVFGVGQAFASVDVVLNMDQVKVTTEDVLPASAPAGQVATGVIVKEREVNRDQPAPLDAANGTQVVHSGTVQREVDYQVGRRIEQVVNQPGAIRQISVVAVVRKQIDADQIEKIKNLVSAAVGASNDRGDTVVVQNLFGSAEVKEENLEKITSTMPLADFSSSRDSAEKKDEHSSLITLDSRTLIVIVLIASIVVISLFFLLVQKTSKAPMEDLSEKDREIALSKIRLWMNSDKENTATFSELNNVLTKSLSRKPE